MNWFETTQNWLFSKDGWIIRIFMCLLEKGITNHEWDVALRDQSHTLTADYYLSYSDQKIISIVSKSSVESFTSAPCLLVLEIKYMHDVPHLTIFESLEEMHAIISNIKYQHMSYLFSRETKFLHRIGLVIFLESKNISKEFMMQR